MTNQSNKARQTSLTILMMALLLTFNDVIADSCEADSVFSDSYIGAINVTTFSDEPVQAYSEPNLDHSIGKVIVPVSGVFGGSNGGCDFGTYFTNRKVISQDESFFRVFDNTGKQLWIHMTNIQDIPFGESHSGDTTKIYSFDDIKGLGGDGPIFSPTFNDTDTSAADGAPDLKKSYDQSLEQLLLDYMPNHGILKLSIPHTIGALKLWPGNATELVDGTAISESLASALELGHPQIRLNKNTNTYEFSLGGIRKKGNYWLVKLWRTDVETSGSYYEDDWSYVWIDTAGLAVEFRSQKKLTEEEQRGSYYSVSAKVVSTSFDYVTDIQTFNGHRYALITTKFDIENPLEAVDEQVAIKTHHIAKRWIKIRDQHNRLRFWMDPFSY
ncbi:MAG: hypothetical protein U1B30_10560 [Pseudomonadota bacterium]|nr:hypothetical protein [Pseudomonadota bacterium]